MARTQAIAAVVSGSLLSLASPASAYIVDITFTGTVSEVVIPSASIGFENIAVGDEWRLMISYESDQIGSGTGLETYGVASPSVLEVFTGGAWIQISDDDTFVDRIGVGNDSDVVGGGIQDSFSYLGFWPADSRVATLVLRDPTASVYSDNQPPTDLDLADFASSTLEVVIGDGQWFGAVTGVTVVPAPGSAAALVAMSALAARRRRAKA